MDLENFNINPFYVLDKNWALLTGGDKDNFNTMTVSWGGMGTLWHKPVVTVYVRPNRYTYQFIKEQDIFTLSFYGEQYKKDLGILGSHSGRDEDKISFTHLTPEILSTGVTFKEAEITLVCKKIYFQNLDEKNISVDIMKQFYSKEPLHSMFIGEVLAIIDKRK